MNWKSIKTFLIFLFLIVNIFLIFLTIQMNNAQKLNDNDISETITLLKKNNISIDSNIIPRVPSESDIIHLTDIYFAGNLNIPDIQRTETGVEIKLPFENSDSSSLEDAINETLKKHGFDTKNIKLSKSDNQYIMTYYVDGIPVFNNNLTISVSDNELALTGTWYVNESKNTYTWQQAGTSYATSALVNFISHPERDKSKHTTITNIEYGYYSASSNLSENIKIVSSSPCYRLTTDDGMMYYYSISEGNFVK